MAGKAEDNVWLTTVVPIFGGIVALALFGSPVKAVLEARRNNTIGKLNVLPFIFIVANCVSWVAYSFVVEDWYLFVPNTLGFLIGLFLFLATFGIGIPDKQERDKLTGAAMILATVLPLVGGIERLILQDNAEAKQLWGYTANVILFMFYCSPLSTLADVLRYRDSSSLTLPLCVMNSVNGSLWLVYGLVRGDAFIWVPNGVGTILGILQTSLCCVFPKRAPRLHGSGSSQVRLRSNSDSASFSAGALTGTSGLTPNGPDFTDRSQDLVAAQLPNGKPGFVPVDTAAPV